MSDRDLAPRLSVVIPIYDEAENVLPLWRELGEVLDKLGYGAEMIFVDDGSRDDGGARVREIASLDARVRLISLDGNHGQSAAFDAGFRAARGEVTATLDGDLQNDPADLLRLLPHLESHDVVNGVRAQRHDSLVRKLSSQIANGFRNWLTEESVTDVGCSLRVMRTEYLRRVKLYRGMHRFLPTLLRMEGARVTEVPVAHRPRRSGRSKYGIRNRLWSGLVDTFAVRWMQRRALRYRATESGPRVRPEARG
ncbi:MAG: glycosyltransferase family 2 protein [Deltaproteobacteria bacterium]|nr:MAG: glycosyltransferase family 2 protein [Deltaproteobacteria bacterium]